MRSPQTTTDDMLFHYDAVQWHKVRKSLAVIGVDADTATVDKKQGSLRAELERLAQQYCEKAQMRFPTVRDFINEATDNAKKIAAVRDLFTPKLWPVAYLIGDKRAAEIHHFLTTVETELQEAAKRAMVGAYEQDFRYEDGRHNAGKPALRNYLLRLAAVWDELAGASGEPRHRNRFLRDCAAPVTGVTIKNVRDFLASKKTKTTI
jgi:hypothetical protein